MTEKDVNKDIQQGSAKETGGKETSKDGAKPSWSHINSDLKSALDTWSELSEQLANKVSPEEEQLRDIKKLLGSLKDKIQEFNDDK